ncbi:glycosyltransferase involved in cell wall biosynthesis [Salinibacter ruber]|uniref:glycosyltransferase n=1 Tax=Salinibacter ruber TaxID=146919 RepID=UPI00216A055D|nr:glycosyltransferase involved in cell wall biosynthesis [Salinibacter ruber]
MSKQVSIVLSSLRGGGAERAMLAVAEGLAERGTRVSLVLIRAGSYDYDVPESVDLVDIGAPRIYMGLPKLAYYFHDAQPDVILSAAASANIVTLAAGLLSRASSRVIVSAQVNITSSSMEGGDWRKSLLLPLARLIYPFADAITTASKGVRQDLLQATTLPSEKIETVYNPVVTSDVFQRASETVEHPWFNQGSPPVILAAGRLSKQKNFSLLLRAFSKVREKREAHLVILGEGPLRSELEESARRLDIDTHVDLPGFVDNPYKYMAQASAFVLSSRWEGFGNVLVEAMACGCPVVSTDCPSGPAEILEGGAWGKLVPVGEVEPMEEAICEALEEPKGQAVDRARQFSPDAIVPKYESILFG